MIKTIFSRVIWVGRATVFTVGLAITLALMLGGATVALAAVPGDPFKLGKSNTINRLSTLVGSTANSMLKVDNNGTGTALDLQVQPGRAPMKVNSDAPVANLNSDKLDGIDSPEFFAQRTRTYVVIGELVNGSGGGSLVNFVNARCDLGGGDKVIGGGGFANDGDDDLFRTFPNLTNGPEGWEVSFQDNGAAGSFNAYALCSDFPPFRP